MINQVWMYFTLLPKTTFYVFKPNCAVILQIFHGIIMRVVCFCGGYHQNKPVVSFDTYCLLRLVPDITSWNISPVP